MQIQKERKQTKHSALRQVMGLLGQPGITQQRHMMSVESQNLTEADIQAKNCICGTRFAKNCIWLCLVMFLRLYVMTLCSKYKCTIVYIPVKYCLKSISCFRACSKTVLASSAGILLFHSLSFKSP